MSIFVPFWHHPPMSAASVPGAGFYAHKNGTNQTGLTTGAYTKITFQTARFDIGSHYDTTNSRWTPPAGLVEIQSQIYCIAHAASSGNPGFVTKVFKNGAQDISAGVGNATVGFPGVAAAAVACTDNASGTDYYEVEFFFTSDDALNDGVVDGNQFHTYFCGKWSP